MSPSIMHNGVERYRWAVLAPALTLVLLLTPVPSGAASDIDPLLAGMTPAEITRLGENMYRQGILPSGEPVQAIVEGDIPVAGTMFTCASCHMRSGIGSIEGTIITPPTNGPELYHPKKPGPRHSAANEERRPLPFITPHDRPAYTDATLGHALAAGIDPSGDVLDPIMPRYLLEPRDLAILVFYLKHLSSEFPPGVSEEALDFATIIAPDVSAADRDAMLMPLKTFIANRNARVPLFKGRVKSGVFAEEMDLSYRKLSLSVWELKDSPDTWQGQLEAFYHSKPVFAVLGGIAKQTWQPMHEFCNRNSIPCIMPATEQPVLSDDNWYVLYTSRGPAREGEAAALYLHMQQGHSGRTARVVQVYRDRGKASLIAATFRDTLRSLGLEPPLDVVLHGDEPPAPDLLSAIPGGEPGSTVAALWLDAADLKRITFSNSRPGAGMVLVSGGILGEKWDAIPGEARRYTYMTYPHRLPQQRKKIQQVVTEWLKQNRLPQSNIAISADIYAMGTMLTDVFMHMKRNYYRDHFLDVFDMQADQTYTVVNYPRLSFGPGQRYLSKGCYIVQLTEGPNPELIPKSDWVIH